MNIDVPCPNCGTVFTLRRDLIGKRTKCTRCGTPFMITEPPAAQSPSRQAPESPQQVSYSDLPAHLAAPAPPQEQFAGIPTHLPVGPPPISAPQSPTAQRQQTAHRVPATQFQTQSNRSASGFPAMRLLARAYEVFALLLFFVFLVCFIVFLVSAITKSTTFLAALMNWGIPSFATLISGLMVLVAAETIRVSLRIEQNTRETQIACRQLADHLCSIETEN
jgi:hypothetical protein